MKTSGWRGTWSEMLASAWLIENGYEVFLAAGNNTCDMVAAKDGKLLRVEVKTVTEKSESSQLGPRVIECKPECYDILIAVMRDGTVLFDPPESQVRRWPSKRRAAD